jgi:uncharacterized membrane protein
VKKNFLKILVLFVSCSCDSIHTEGEQQLTRGEDTIATVKVKVSTSAEENKRKSFDRLIFEARGNEPGWFVRIYENHLQLVTDYGNDSLIIHEAVPDFKGKFEYNSPDKKTQLSIVLKKANCIDDKGDTNPFEVEVKWNEKLYTGCGNKNEEQTRKPE